MRFVTRVLSDSTWNDLESLLAPETIANLRVAFAAGAIGGFVAYATGRAVGCCTFGVSLLGVEPLRGVAASPVFTVLPGREGAERALLKAALAGMKKAKSGEKRRNEGLVLPGTSPGAAASDESVVFGSRLRLVVR